MYCIVLYCKCIAIIGVFFKCCLTYLGEIILGKVGLTEEDSRVCLDELAQLLTSTQHINTSGSMLMDYHQMKKDNGARYQIARRGSARNPSTFAQYDATNACYAMIVTMILGCPKKLVNG